MNRRTKIIWALAAFGLTCSGANAQGMGMGMGMGGGLPPFAEIDANEDGKLSKEELAEYVAGGRLDMLFERWDANSDGSVDEKEFENRRNAGR